MKFVSLCSLKAMGREKKFVIPCLFTLFNACCGFLSLIKTLEGNYSAASYFIIVAVFMDMLDGRVARVLRSTSAIGMELDSLADAVSFCVAPAVLLYSGNNLNTSVAGVIVLSLYLCAGLSRLARFNVSEPKPFFIGLPTTVAAFCIAQFMLQESWFAYMGWTPSYTVLLSLIAALGMLMVSPVRYPAFKKGSSGSKTRMLGVLGIIYICAWWLQFPFFLLCSLLYIVFGFLCV